MKQSVLYKVKKFEEAYNEEKKASLAWDKANKKENELYKVFMDGYASKINEYLSSIGVGVRFDHKKDFDIDHFVSKHPEFDAKTVEKIFSYSDSLPRFESGIDFPEQKSGLSFKAVIDLNMPLDLKRKDFSSDEIFEDYKQNVYSLTHNFD